MNARTLPEIPLKAPACPEGLIRYEWHTDCDVPIVCHLEFEPAEGDGWELPRYDESMTLGAAYIRDVNIIGMLTSAQIEYIESSALCDLKGIE